MYVLGCLRELNIGVWMSLLIYGYFWVVGVGMRVFVSDLIL